MPGSTHALRLLSLLGAWLVIYELNVLVNVVPADGLLFGRPAALAVSFLAAAICAAGALRQRGAPRAAWLMVALGIAAWNAGDAYWRAVLIDQETIPVPSPADLGYLAFPLLLLPAVFLLLRPAARVYSRLLVVDAVAAGLAVSAVAANLVVGDAITGAEGVLTNLAYPITDLVLLGLAVGAIAVRGWRLSRTWALVGAAMIAFAAADTNYLIAIADGSYTFPDPFDAGWTLCFLLLAAAAWQPGADEQPLVAGQARAAILPVVFGALALAVVAFAGFAGGQRPAVALAVASLLAVGVRLLATLRESAAALDGSRREALSDALTGLGNRRALTVDLRASLARATDQHPEVLVLYDLDGFKHYNDSFGHPAGDALLARLGRRLAVRLPDGVRAYRIGGDEFCVLGPAGDGAEVVRAAGSGALSDAGAGFAVTASDGTVTLPVDAQDAEQALRIADQRMYARKHSGRTSAGRQVADVLVAALVEREGGLGDHVRDVAALATRVARHLELDEAECELIGQAAALHDVGKVAIPDAILDKPGPLTDAEWTFMRRHTLIGERIIGAAPALGGVAQIVRSSHERWDGRGYPDGLAAEAIPLGARIVAVCDAFDAMRACRPYSPAIGEPEALAELVACAGQQFDPSVVAAFCGERAGRGDAAAERPQVAAR